MTNATPRADRSRPYRALPIMPNRRDFRAAFVPGLGGVVVGKFVSTGEFYLHHASRALGQAANSAAYDAAVRRAVSKFAGREARS